MADKGTSNKRGPKPKQESKGDGKRKESVKEFKARMARESKANNKNAENVAVVHDHYEKVSSSVSIIKQMTGIVYDDLMKSHKNEYDVNHPENPNRYAVIMSRLQELGLVNRCKQIDIKKATKEQIALLHDKKLYDHLQKICKEDVVDVFEAEASKYDSIYFNQCTLDAACISAGGVITLVEEIAKGNIQNGMAIVRPPGHHAMTNEFNGYCFFNNVALAASLMLQKNYVKKILIIDHDVHHGQGTQRFFYNNPSVLYMSIHRYENGLFWPNLRESNYDYVGNDAGAGYNINVPLNKIGATDNDYLNIVLHILLPVAYEFNPDLIIVSAGYDSALGDKKGQMKVTPGFYGHLIKLFSGLANGKIAVCLEGGYFLPSLAEGAAMSLKALLDDPVCTLHDITLPSESIIQVINDLKCILRPFWKCFEAIATFDVTDTKLQNIHVMQTEYLGELVRLKPPYPTRDCYPQNDKENGEVFDTIINELKKEYELLNVKPVAYTYDEELLKHAHPGRKTFVECPNRLKNLMEKFREFNLHDRCEFVPGKYADDASLTKVHNINYVKALINNNIASIMHKNGDLFYNEHTSNCILKSAGCLINLVDHIMKGDALSGAALIRPPGHHADYDLAAGFCFINNVSVAAAHILFNYNVKRILIVDFDIHHGNGTQNSFYQSNEVLYISLHRYDEGKFYPNSEDANYENIGIVKGCGYNINIPFNKDNMGNFEYISAFHRIVLPIAYGYNPEVVLVSAGFDAGINDPLGHYKLTPEVFGHFIQMLKPLANGKLILALEGGYNCNTLAYSMISCIKTLLGDPLPKLDDFNPLIQSAATTITNVIDGIKLNWPILQTDKMLPDIRAMNLNLLFNEISEIE